MSRRTLVIDGYNVIGALSTLRGDRLAQGRDALMARLSRYAAVRGHRVIVVFDGLPGGSPDRLRRPHPGVEARFSGLDEKADPVLVRLARELRGDCVVVSDDHGVRRPCEHTGAVVLHGAELDRLLSRSEREPVPASPPVPVPRHRPAAAPPVATLSDADRAAWEAFTVGVEPLPAPAPAPMHPGTIAPERPPSPPPGALQADPVVPDSSPPESRDPWEVPDSVVAAKDADEDRPDRGHHGPSRDERRRRHILDDL